MQSEYEKHAIEGRRLLTAALEQFKKAKAQRTADRTRLAISSAKGAVRAAGYRAQRQAEIDNDPIAWRNNRRQVQK